MKLNWNSTINQRRNSGLIIRTSRELESIIHQYHGRSSDYSGELEPGDLETAGLAGLTGHPTSMLHLLR